MSVEIYYHPVSHINEEVRQTSLAAEAADFGAGFGPWKWTCICGASHRRGHFPLGSDGHRCLNCGYVGNGGVIEP